MNKILILFSFLFVFSLKINAYEYEFFHYDRNGSIIDRFFYDSNGNLVIKQISNNSESLINTDSYFYVSLSGIKFHTEGYYILNSKFEEYYKNDLSLLNDFYIQKTNIFLNYLYNNERFHNSYIKYTNYKILYDENGLAVESIVNGIWKGLYNTEEELNNSGWLYDRQNNIYYYNQYEASFIGQLERRLLKFYKNVIIGTFSLNVIGIILIFIFACVILRVVLNLVHHFLTRSRFNFNIGKRF